MVTAPASKTSTQVVAYEERMEKAWDSYVHAHPSTTLFHLSAWKRVIERAFGFEARYLQLESEGRIAGVLPLFLVKNRILGKALISTPFAVYGGICADQDEAAGVLRAHASRMAREEAVEYLELREQSPAFDPEFRTKQLYVTFDRELPATPDLLLKSFPRDTRYMIRKAQKNDLCLVKGNDQLAVFYEIYAHSVHNLGTPVFSRKFFEILLQEFGNTCEVAVVYQKTRAVAAVVSFRFRNWILPYYGGSLLEGRPLAANNFMYWEVMKQALESGAQYFDFGRSKLGTGAYAFKQQWSMRERPLPYQFLLVNREEMPNFSPVNPRFKLATSLWRRVPFALTKVVGPELVRLFP